ncbi:MAG: Glu-tRNA(Gln) amidotransferase subunit GatE, partial [Candidatus Aminicenantes bacterium]|nr:Glu-tRNA(Gln) amidotransferase subunit GatE [Candidatus Aminicenantes bacterium]
TLSELGEYDGTALMEFKTKKDIIYQIHKDSVCTYEFDDTPPFPVNQGALDIALEIAMLLECQLVDEIHISRKQYLDGSIPTGFQRTTIVGVDGRIPFKDGRVIRVVQLALEEDACREVSDSGHLRVYRTDRLGMPLIEVVTYPDMRTPQEVAEAGQVIRRITRSTNKVRRGLGATRQDVNVSVEGGTRVEIKGVPRIPLFPRLTHNEALRQWNLLRIRDLLLKRGLTAASLEWRADDLAGLLKTARFEPLRRAAREGLALRAVTLRGLAGILREPTQEGTLFWKEISDRVRVIACLTDLPNLIHSDLPEGTLSETDWRKVRKFAGAGRDDAVVVIWGPEADVETAVKEIVIRVREAAVGVPSETRQALPDGTNGFERILPGPDRMYPDTDSLPIEITSERIERIRRARPRLLGERLQDYRSRGLSEDLTWKLLLSPRVEDFDALLEGDGVDAVLTADILVNLLPCLRRLNRPVETLDRDALRSVLGEHRQGRLTRAAAKDVLAAMPGGARDFGLLLKDKRRSGLDEAALRRRVREIIDKNRSGAPALPEARRRFLMGRLMESLRYEAEGRDVARWLDASPQEREDDVRRPA